VAQKETKGAEMSRQIIDINGNPYTSAAEDMRLVALKQSFRKVLAGEILSAMRRAKGPDMQLCMKNIENFLDQAYLMGREDQG
jgi:hypothetical protein